MNPCKECRELFLDGLFQNLDNEKQAHLEAHLTLCPRCASAYAEARETLQIMDRRVEPSFPESYWESYELNLLEKLQKSAIQVKSPEKKRRTSLRWTFGLAAAAAILVIGILIGRLTFSEIGPGMRTMTETTSFDTPFQFTKLQQRTNQYFERSKVIILGLINFGMTDVDPYILDFDRNQKISGDLILEAGYLKENLDGSGQGRLAELVSELEIILMQIANLDKDDHIEGLEMIKSGVHRNSLLMKIDVERMRQTTSEDKKPPAAEIHTS